MRLASTDICYPSWLYSFAVLSERPKRTSLSMTWKRVATAAVLIPVVIAIVLFTNTAVVAIATAAITILALREYFALGDAIGHRAYRLWTIFCSLLLPQIDEPISVDCAYEFCTFIQSPRGHRVTIPIQVPSCSAIDALYSPTAVIFLFVFWNYVSNSLDSSPTWLNLFLRRESRASALLLVAFPLSFAVRLHGDLAARPRNTPLRARPHLGRRHHRLLRRPRLSADIHSPRTSLRRKLGKVPQAV